MISVYVVPCLFENSWHIRRISMAGNRANKEFDDSPLKSTPKANSTVKPKPLSTNSKHYSVPPSKSNVLPPPLPESLSMNPAPLPHNPKHPSAKDSSNNSNIPAKNRNSCVSRRRTRSTFRNS